jgi:hypothetical protein
MSSSIRVVSVLLVGSFLLGSAIAKTDLSHLAIRRIEHVSH